MKLEKIPEVTEEQWLSINKENRNKVEEFLRESVQLSQQTINQYTSALRIYFYWIKENADDKAFWEIRSVDYLRFQNYLIRRGLSSSAVRFKRSAVSSFNIYLETYYSDTYTTLRNYITKKIAAPPQVKVHEKEPLMLQEYKHLCDKLEEGGMWEQLAYLKFSFATGCRREEVRQLTKDVTKQEPKISNVVVDVDGKPEIRESKTYFTGNIRCKGRGKDGKVRKLQFDESAMIALKKWLDNRGEDDNPYVFVSKGKDTVSQISAATMNYWCTNIFSEIVGRRVHPHLIRSSRATTLVVESGRNIESVQKLLGHNNVATTSLYVIKKDDEYSDDLFVD